MNSLEILKGIGEQRLHEKSHIAIKYIKDLLDENYSSMSKTQCYGFLSILQREFKLDLEDIKARAKVYYDSLEPTSLKELNELRTINVASKKTNPKVIYFILLVIVLFAGAKFYIDKQPQESAASVALQDESTLVEKQETPKEDELVQDIAQDRVLEEDNLSETQDDSLLELDEPKEQEAIEQKSVEEEKTSPNELVVVPKSKVWVGYIDIQTHKKYQATTDEPISIDGKKDWLLLLGHANLSIKLDDEAMEFKHKGDMRLLYKEGVIKEITHSEFVELNGGKEW